jgi:hypothetical protein
VKGLDCTSLSDHDLREIRTCPNAKGGLGSVACIDLAKNITDVDLDRTLRYPECATYDLVCIPELQMLKYLYFTIRELRLIHFKALSIMAIFSALLTTVKKTPEFCLLNPLPTQQLLKASPVTGVCLDPSRAPSRR